MAHIEALSGLGSLTSKAALQDAGWPLYPMTPCQLGSLSNSGIYSAWIESKASHAKQDTAWYKQYRDYLRDYIGVL